MIATITPFIMLAGAASVLLNWTQEYSMALWLYIDALCVFACALGARSFWNETQGNCKIAGALLGVLGVVVVLQFIVVGVADHIAWEVIDFFLVMGLTLGAGLLLKRP